MSKKARDIMTKDPLCIRPDAPVVEAVKILLRHHFNGLPVTDEDGLLVGIICQSDLVAQQKKLDTPSFFAVFDGVIPFGNRHMEKDFQKITAVTVEQAMTKNPVIASPDTKLEDIASLMVKAKYYSIPVIEHGKLIGIIGKEDILQTLV